MPFELDLTWVRTCRVVEKGTASILVDNPNDAIEIDAKLRALDFHTFRTEDREYGDQVWSCQMIETGQDNDNSPTATDSPA